MELFQEVREALVTELAANPLFHITTTRIASTPSAHCLISNGRRHSIIKSGCRLESWSTHIIHIVVVDLLNILDIIRAASIILLLITASLIRVVFEIKLRLITLLVVPLKRVSFRYVLCI